MFQNDGMTAVSVERFSFYYLQNSNYFISVVFKQLCFKEDNIRRGSKLWFGNGLNYFASPLFQAVT